MARKPVPAAAVEGSAAEEAGESPAAAAAEGDHPVVHRPHSQTAPYPE